MDGENKEQIKILELCDSYLPNVDGVVNVMRNYAKYINGKEICAVAAPSVKKKLKFTEQDDFEVFRCKSLSAPEGYRCAVPQFDAKFRKKLKKANFDIMHTHSPFTIGRCAVKFAKQNNIPLVATLHTQYHLDFERVLKGNKPLVKFMIRFIMKTFNNAYSVWTVSERSKDFLRMYGYKGEIEVVRNGTDYVYPDNPEELIDRVNKIHNLQGQKNVFLFVGRMAIYKNLKLICEAMKMLSDKGADFKMIFVGGGFDIKELIEYVEKLGITDKVIFTDTIRDRSLLQGYYLRSDLFIFPSTFDMASVSKVEAAVHKIPSVVVKDSCSAEQVVDGENGFIIEDSAKSLCDKLVYLMDNPELVKKAGQKAYETLARSWQDVAEEVRLKYREIIEKYKAEHKD